MHYNYRNYVLCFGMNRCVHSLVYVHVYVVYSEIENGDRFKSLSSPFQDVYTCMYMYIHVCSFRLRTVYMLP